MGSLFIGASLSADANEINFKDAELLFSSRGNCVAMQTEAWGEVS